MMHSHQSVLHVCTSSHLLCRTEKHTNLSGSYLGKEFFLLRFGICRVNKCDFRFRHTCHHQLCFHIIIHIKSTVIFRCGHITKQKLCQFLTFAFFPDFQNISDAGIDLAVRVIGKQRIHKALIQSNLSAITGNLQHVVNRRVNHTGMHRSCSL